MEYLIEVENLNKNYPEFENYKIMNDYCSP